MMLIAKTTFLFHIIGLSIAIPQGASSHISPLGPLIPVITTAPPQTTLAALPAASTVTTMVVVSGTEFVGSTDIAGPSNPDGSLTTPAASSGITLQPTISITAVSQATSAAAPASPSTKSTSGIVLGATLGGVGILFILFCIFILFYQPKRKSKNRNKNRLVAAQRYSDFPDNDRKPIMYGKEDYLSRSTSAASNPYSTKSNRTFWRDSGTFIEPLELNLGPIDGSGRISRLSFSTFFKPGVARDVQQITPTGPNWPLVDEPPYPQIHVRDGNWNYTTALFPMPPPPVKVRNGQTIYEHQNVSKSSLKVPENLGKLNKWFRENKIEEHV